MRLYSVDDFECDDSSEVWEFNLIEPVTTSIGSFHGLVVVPAGTSLDSGKLNAFSILADWAGFNSDLIASVAVAHARHTREHSSNPYILKTIPARPTLSEITSDIWTSHSITLSHFAPPFEDDETLRNWTWVSLGVTYAADDGLTMVVERGAIVRVNGRSVSMRHGQPYFA
jgi:hypothetical protein